MLKYFQHMALVVGLATLLFSCEGKREVVSDVQEKQANEIIVFLAAKGINAEKVTQTTTTAGGGGGDAQAVYTIMAPSNQATEAIAILNRNGLPRRPTTNLLSLFAKSGLVSSSQEEQIRYQEGLSEQVAGTIRKIDGVIDAVVQISFPSPEQALSPGEKEQEEVRASVYVKHTGVLDDPNSQLVVKIKRLVAGSVGGLNYDNVTVVTDRARFTDVDLEMLPDSAPDDAQDYTRIWGMVMAKESVGTFRSIFFFLLAVIFVLAVFLAWIVWKTFPAIQRGGGVGQIFNSVNPLHFEGLPEKKKKAEGEEEEDFQYEEEPAEEEEEGE